MNATIQIDKPVTSTIAEALIEGLHGSDREALNAGALDAAATFVAEAAAVRKTGASTILIDSSGG